MAKESLIDFNFYIPKKNGDIISKKTKKAMTNKVLVGGYVSNTYKHKNEKLRPRYRHRVIWYYFNGEIPEGMQIDHINGDKTDNRLENLRLVTPKENLNNPNTRKYMEEHVWSSEERNEKISAKQKGKIITNEQKEKQSLAMSGDKHPFYGKKRPKQSEMMKQAKRDKNGRFLKRATN